MGGRNGKRDKEKTWKKKVKEEEGRERRAKKGKEKRR